MRNKDYKHKNNKENNIPEEFNFYLDTETYL